MTQMRIIQERKMTGITTIAMDGMEVIDGEIIGIQITLAMQGF